MSIINALQQNYKDVFAKLHKSIADGNFKQSITINDTQFTVKEIANRLERLLDMSDEIQKEKYYEIIIPFIKFVDESVSIIGLPLSAVSSSLTQIAQYKKQFLNLIEQLRLNFVTLQVDESRESFEFNRCETIYQIINLILKSLENKFNINVPLSVIPNSIKDIEFAEKFKNNSKYATEYRRTKIIDEIVIQLLKRNYLTFVTNVSDHLVVINHQENIENFNLDTIACRDFKISSLLHILKNKYFSPTMTGLYEHNMDENIAPYERTFLKCRIFQNMEIGELIAKIDRMDDSPRYRTISTCAENLIMSYFDLHIRFIEYYVRDGYYISDQCNFTIYDPKTNKFTFPEIIKREMDHLIAILTCCLDM